jgi:NADH-quinone oxidoreductase subunit I/NAD(P)H-quinone oxidoreductase subunit I
MFCGLCVEPCPTGSIQHTREFEGSARNIRNLTFRWSDPLAPFPVYKVDKNAEYYPRAPLGSLVRAKFEAHAWNAPAPAFLPPEPAGAPKPAAQPKVAAAAAGGAPAPRAAPAPKAAPTNGVPAAAAEKPVVAPEEVAPPAKAAAPVKAPAPDKAPEIAAAEPAVTPNPETK